MISEYAIGRHGYLMTLSFAASAISSVSLFAALLRSPYSALGRVGLGFLMLAAMGPAIGGAFAMDPTTTNQEAMSYSGKMHGVGFMIGVPGELLAVLCLSLALRRQPTWAAVPLLTIALVAWASLGDYGAVARSAALLRNPQSTVHAGVRCLVDSGGTPGVKTGARISRGNSCSALGVTGCVPKPTIWTAKRA